MANARRGMQPIFLLMLATPYLNSCQSNYLVEPITMPHFSRPWESTLQANLTNDHKLFFNAGASLPLDIAVTVSRESWGSGLDNDQELTSIAVGKFWVHGPVTWLTMGGIGSGSQRTGPGYGVEEFQGFAQAPAADLPPNASLNVSYLDEKSDFRNYFIEASFTHTSYSLGYGSSYQGEIKMTWGFLSRLEYLDRFRYSQSVAEIQDTTGDGTLDTTFTIDRAPNHLLSWDFGGFISSSIPYLQWAELYAEVLGRRPISGNSQFLEWGTAVAGVRVTF